jgi:Flp pilus assembly protein TadD
MIRSNPSIVQVPMSDIREIIQQGMSAFNNGDAGKAAKLFRRALPQSPNDPDLLHLAAISHIQSGNELRGKQFLKKALKVSPLHSDANNTLGVLKRHEFRLSEAITAFEKAMASNPQNARACKNLGQALCDSNQDDLALPWFRKLAELRPTDSTALYLLGTALMSLGELEAATNSFRRTTEMDPANGYAWQHIAQIDASQITDADIESIKAALAEQTDNPEAGGKLATALYRVYEKRQEHNAASDCLVQGNLLRRKSLEYDIVDDEREMAETAKAFDAAFLNGPSPASLPGPQPIFVLGLPRSGTSLVEQILSSHSQVSGAGEVASVRNSLERIPEAKNQRFPGYVQHLKSGRLSAIAADVQKIICDSSPQPTPFITDKTPRNFLYIGLIKRIWPEARIIHCQRNLMDCAWSNYRIQFGSGNEYAYDQDEMIRYFRAKEKLMAHWQSICPDGFLNLSYEAMVADQEGETRRLLKYCGLEWEDDCLQFHQNSRPVRTASSVQVRSPIYKTSIKAWEPYADILAPMIKALAEK